MSNTSAPVIAPVTAIDPAKVHGQLRDLFDSSITWLQTNWMQILIALGIGAVIVVGLHFIRNLGNRLCQQDRRLGGWGMVFGRAVVRTNNFFIVMLAAKLVVGYADAPAALATTVNFLFTVAVVFQAAIWAREIILGSVEHRTSRENYNGEALVSAMGLIRLLVTFVLFAIALIVVLDNLGVNVTGLVAGLGVGGIAIGLAAQGIFADLFAALAIIFDRPFRRGDAVTYDTTSGTVEEIGLKSTRIRGLNGEERIISNKNLLDKEIQNNTRRERRRIKFAIGVVYQTTPEVCLAIPGMFKEIVEAHEMVFVRAGFINFGASSLDFEVEFDTPLPDFQHAYDARHAVGLAILKRFNDEKIEIAYPTQTTFTAAPDGRMVMPYPQVQAVRAVAPAQ